MFCRILSIFLIGVNRISGSPGPLVSSSGMIPMVQPFVESENKESHYLKREIHEEDAPLLPNKKQIGLSISEPESRDHLRVIKGYGDTSSDMIDTVGNPITWDASPPASNKDSIVWESGEDSEINVPENVVYSKKIESVLRPYATETKFITIPTVIINQPTAKSELSLKSIKTVAVPQVHDRSMVLNSGHREKTPDTLEYSAIEGGEPSLNESIIFNSPKFVFVDKNQLYSDTFDELVAQTRITRTSRNTTTEQLTSKQKQETNENKDDVGMKGHLIASKLGPPWEDDEIVGRLHKDKLVGSTEVSFKVASKLCNTIASRGPPSFDQPRRYYLWAPINQYLPLLRKAFPIRPPLFAPECLKWVLRQCRGTIRLPMLKPCTYWAPMPIRRPECGFNPTLQSKMVNFRLPEFVPGMCPCVWPCTRQFDPVQRCRVAVNKTDLKHDHIHSDGDPWNKKEIVIQENLAEQLCRGMKLALTEGHTFPIGWIPIRADVVAGAANANSTNKTSEGSFRRKKEIIRNSALKVKRERVFVNPEKVSGESSSEEDDENWLSGRLMNKTGSNCKVWKYKACPRDQKRTELMADQQHINPEGRRNKRNLRPYMSTLPLKDKNSKHIGNMKRLVRYSGYDEDDEGFEKDCGEWTQSESNRCIPEERIQIPIHNTDMSSEEDSQEQKKLPVTNEKKTIQKELCPGSVGKFPCFLRKKRSLLNSTNDVQLEADKGSSEQESASMYIINKIMIQPDPSCMCEWPCLPFFDRVNKCYYSKGKLVVDSIGRPKVTARSFRKNQRDPVVCINFVESDEIYCKIKK